MLCMHLLPPSSPSPGSLPQLVAAVSHWRHDWEHLQALKLKHAAQSELQTEISKREALEAELVTMRKKLNEALGSRAGKEEAEAEMKAQMEAELEAERE